MRLNVAAVIGERSPWREATAVAAVAAACFLLLRTSDYQAVDGGLRAIQVYRLGNTFLHANNHMLYPVNVYWWASMWESIGLRAEGPIEYLGLAQSMNAVAAAGAIGLLFFAMRALKIDLVVALLLTCGYAFCRAVAAHATAAAEPMVGLFWSALAIASVVVGATRSSQWLHVVGGFIFALAMATYQGMISIGPAVLIPAWMLSARSSPAPDGRVRTLRVLAVAVGLLVGLSTIYGAAYYWNGTRGAGEMVRRFFVVPASNVYGGITPVKVLSLLPGLAYAMFPCLPRKCEGFRCLLDGQFAFWLGAAGLASLLAAAWVGTLVVLIGRTWRELTRVERTALASTLVGLASTSIPLVYYFPTYDKVWLQPLACLSLASAIVVNRAWRIPGGYWRRLAVFLLGGAGLIVVCNLPVTISRHAGPIPYIDEAMGVVRTVGPDDLLVGDWNEVFLWYQALQGKPDNIFNLPTQLDITGARTPHRLEERISAVRQAGRMVFFLGLLDTPEAEWGASHSGRRGFEYGLLERYRSCATPVASFDYYDRPLSLRRLAWRQCDSFATPDSFVTAERR